MTSIVSGGRSLGGAGDERRPTDVDAVAQEARQLGPWFHNLHLPGGVQTEPRHFLGDFPAFKWHRIETALPSDLRGWTALDVGCNAGFYSFELAKRGATVTGVDVDEHYLRQAQWAARQYDMDGQVQFRQMHVYDLARTAEHYDLVLFMGLFYHLRHPLLALDILAAKTDRLMLFQTFTSEDAQVHPWVDNFELPQRDMMAKPGWPRMAFIESSFSGDPTNWWAANHACCIAMLRSASLHVISQPEPEVYLCERQGPISPLVLEEIAAATGTQRTDD